MKKKLYAKALLSYFFLTLIVEATQLDSFEKGIELFKKNQFEKSKIHFERDLVFNPKNEKSYLYLAKIFKERENDEETEINLNNVLLLNPQNDEAVYMLTLLKIKQYDYKHAQELKDQFALICKKFCSKKNEIEEKLEKLNPENAKSND
tara:strand:- start:5864 stop:6310 length:447 start_codon:yes stop_codon:yes gene_type:complete